MQSPQRAWPRERIVSNAVVAVGTIIVPLGAATAWHWITALASPLIFPAVLAFLVAVCLGIVLVSLTLENLLPLVDGELLAEDESS